ncbi:hypothetical protein [Candidatus Uabimicrobium amorphum]|uniref:Uncharacterized protein n=1 Tax=Uabimicrobium amorphum TaxID=2596890 RepID=A0A5S9IIN8_UABAM|nr:hypothetical protein [Candidatus Uabimicrobium amorphum]BBM82186.1 hypothetical protein UABAM_00529 [Candidatus Uabimicrobium amorphum]
MKPKFVKSKKTTLREKRKIKKLDPKNFTVADLHPDFIEGMESLRYNPNAKCHYELFSGGLLWTDERSPEAENRDKIWCELLVFRILLMYRSAIILRVEDNAKDYKRIWEKLNEAFPHWLIFRPDRQSNNHAQRIIEGLKNMKKELEEM